jgi:nitrate/nitrite-specific signal transduction histidine kinase
LEACVVCCGHVNLIVTGRRPGFPGRITDDGVGLPTGRPAGIGLTAMAERAAELGGTCEFTPGPAGGTDVVARLPLGVAG